MTVPLYLTTWSKSNKTRKVQSITLLIFHHKTTQTTTSRYEGNLRSKSIGNLQRVFHFPCQACTSITSVSIIAEVKKSKMVAQMTIMSIWWQRLQYRNSIRGGCLWTFTWPLRVVSGSLWTIWASCRWPRAAIALLLVLLRVKHHRHHMRRPPLQLPSLIEARINYSSTRATAVSSKSNKSKMSCKESSVAFRSAKRGDTSVITLIKCFD